MKLRRVVSVASVNIHLRQVRFDMNPMPLPSGAGAGGLVSDHVLVAEGAAGFDRRLSCLDITLRAEVESTGFFRKLFQHIRTLVLTRLIDWLRDETWTERSATG